MADKVNGKVTNVEMEIMVDDLRAKLPYLIENAALTAKLLKAKYDTLVAEGFTAEQAMEIVTIRPMYE